MNYTLITDGAYSSSRNQGGIGLVFLKNGEKILEYSRMFKGVTNNIMEVCAVIVGLRMIKNPINSLTIYTDSEYVIGCATKGWKRKKNVELWNLYDKVFTKASQFCSDIKFCWVRGHTSNSDFFSEMNNLADKLAVEASQEYEAKKEKKQETH